MLWSISKNLEKDFIVKLKLFFFLKMAVNIIFPKEHLKNFFY